MLLSCPDEFSWLVLRYFRSYKNGYVGLMVLHLLLLMNSWLIVETWPVKYFFKFITLRNVHRNLTNWLLFLILVGVLLVMLIGCMIILSAFRNLIRMPILIVSFPAQLDFKTFLHIECFHKTLIFESSLNRVPIIFWFFLVSVPIFFFLLHILLYL